MDIITYALSKKYTNDTIIGLGALKGASCTIQDIVETDVGDFADINSLTEDAFTGDTTAVYGNPYGKNNGVTLVTAPEDLGLTSPCTTVQLVQTMRNTFNKTITSGAIGVFNNGGSTITDAPSDYGLLHIETFGHDRTMIRYDGIGSSTYAGSWIGQIKGSNGTFSDITWFRLDAETADTPWTALTIDTSTGYQNGNGYTTYYSIKNGIVYIQTTLGCTTPYSGGWKIVATGLPKPGILINYRAPRDTGSDFLPV